MRINGLQNGQRLFWRNVVLYFTACCYPSKAIPLIELSADTNLGCVHLGTLFRPVAVYKNGKVPVDLAKLDEVRYLIVVSREVIEETAAVEHDGDVYKRQGQDVVRQGSLALRFG